MGFAVAPTIRHYLEADPQAVWQAGGATALFIGGFGAAGYADAPVFLLRDEHYRHRAERADSDSRGA